MSWSAFDRVGNVWVPFVPGPNPAGSHRSSTRHIHPHRLEAFAGAARRRWSADWQNLPELPRSSRPILAKDGSLRAGRLQFFAFQELADSGPFAEGLAQIGLVEGFSLQLLTLPEEFPTWQSWLEEKQLFQVELVCLPDGYPWLEDMGETLSGGELLVPPEFPDDELGSQAVAVVDTDRRRRYVRRGVPELVERADQFAGQGMCNARQLQRAGLGLALLAPGRGRISLSYLEGGNLLSGRRAGGEPFALVGRDSLALSRSILEFCSGREWRPEQVARLVAAELGLTRRQLIAVEQPGVYHLDLRIASIGPGHIALQDSPPDAEWCAQLEDLAQADMEKAGLRVTRLRGAWPQPGNPQRDQVNFFNSRHLACASGGWFGVYTGGQAEQQSAFLEALSRAGSPLRRAYFFDAELGAGSLAWLGGIKCRTKAWEAI